MKEPVSNYLMCKEFKVVRVKMKACKRKGKTSPTVLSLPQSSHVFIDRLVFHRSLLKFYVCCHLAKAVYC